MNEIQLQLEKLEAIFRISNAPVLQFLNPGLRDEEIEMFFSKNNLPIHVDLKTMYNWHNGLTSIYGRPGSLVEFSPLGSFPNLTEMLALRSDFLSYNYFEVKNRGEYIPLLSGGEDDMHLLKVSTGEIYYSSPGIQVFCVPRFHSLSSMLGFILRSYDSGALTIHPIKGLLIDDSYWEISDDYNN